MNTSDFAQIDTAMRNDKSVNCLTGTVKMTKSKLSECDMKGERVCSRLEGKISACDAAHVCFGSCAKPMHIKYIS